VNGIIEESYGGHVVIQAFGAEDKTIAAFEKENGKLFGSAWKSQFFSGVMMPAMMFVGNLGYVGVCVAGGFLAVAEKLKAGDILAFIQYVRMFTQPISQVAQIANVIQSTVAAAERVFEFMEEPEEAPDAENPVSPANVSGGVTFENVRFGYNPEQLIIKNFSANIEQGRRVAIVGPTGAGKTTLVKLLMRYYELNGGAIMVDGRNINEFTREGLRSLTAMVLQDTWLFSGTIRENIRYGNLSATDEEVRAAAEAAHVHHYIRTLPGGYDMTLNEESSNISQGQKQLLTIARAILSKPKILILDEATSSVDTRTEVIIQKAMEELMKGRTSFIIAHRLSTIKNADWILVLNDGDIAEQGTHASLLAAGGFYAALYNSQFDA
jgi:ATP-binding cassette subfamily B protein